MLLPETEIVPGVWYLNHPHHRSTTQKDTKSQWIISVAEEVQAFTHAHGNGWLQSSAGWGLHLESGIVAYLGTLYSDDSLLFIAKFVDGTATSHWHGYPIDHRRSYDAPSTAILNVWLVSKLLSAAQIRKIARGQPCSL